MNVLFLLLTPPELKERPNLYTELIEEFRDRGHRVWAAAMEEKKYGRPTRLVEEEGIRKLYVRTGNFFNVSPVIKGVTTARIGSRFIRAIRQFLPDTSFDLVLMPTPPITFSGVMEYVKRRDRATGFLILRDIFPQNARDMGLMNNGLLFRYFRRKEKEMYRAADRIGCMSRGNIDYVLTHNRSVPKEKCLLLPNWAKIRDPGASDETAPASGAVGGAAGRQGSSGQSRPEQDSGDRRFAGVRLPEDAFACVFGGNLGWAQGLDFLLELAEAVKEYPDIIFLLIGDGVEKKRLMALAREKGLENVFFLGQLKREEYDAVAAGCQVGLINLDRRFTIPNIPSKTTGYFAAGLPVLAAVDPHTDYGELLEASGAGLWSVTGDLESYKNNLLRLYRHPELAREMGRRGRAYLREELSVEQAYCRIMEAVDHEASD